MNNGTNGTISTKRARKLRFARVLGPGAGPGASTQDKIRANIEVRWDEAVVLEKYREQATILEWLVRQARDEGCGEIPEHHANIREKVAVFE